MRIYSVRKAAARVDSPGRVSPQPAGPRYVSTSLAFAMALLALASCGASYRTANFLITAESPEHARLIGEDAERFRKSLASEWLGEPLPRWSEPCPIQVQITNERGGRGETSYVFEAGQPVSWRMTLRGSLEKVRTSVLPHEISHTIFATHFGKPMPRWAEEGACVIVEHEQDRRMLDSLLPRHVELGRTYRVREMFQLRSYPDDVLPFYTQGYSLVNFFVTRGGKKKFVQFLERGMAERDWARVTRQYYGYSDLDALETDWIAWATHDR